MEAFDKFFRFATSRTIAYGNSFYLILFYETVKFETRTGILILRLMRKNCLIVEQVSLCIKTYDLTTCAETRIDTHNAFLTQWRSKKKLFQVTGKDMNSFFISLMLALSGKFSLDARTKQTLVSIGNSCLHLHSSGRSCFDERTFYARETIGIVGRTNAHTQIALTFASTHSQQTMGCTTSKRLTPIEIVTKFASLSLTCFNNLGTNHGGTFKGSTHSLARTLIFIHTFGYNIARSLQRLVNICHFAFHKKASGFLGLIIGFRQQEFG